MSIFPSLFLARSNDLPEIYHKLMLKLFKIGPFKASISFIFVFSIQFFKNSW